MHKYNISRDRASARSLVICVHSFVFVCGTFLRRHATLRVRCVICVSVDYGWRPHARERVNKPFRRFAVCATHQGRRRSRSHDGDEEAKAEGVHSWLIVLCLISTRDKRASL